MDEMFNRLNRIYPNSSFVLISKYNPENWKTQPYDSSLDKKAALNRWKSNPLTYDEACEKIEEGYRIGWVVPEGMCVVDIDNKDDERSQEYITKILEKFEVSYSYNDTFHGMHIVFRDPSKLIKSDSVTKCALNIDIDTRANGSGYIILPVNDPHRKWGKWNDFVEEIPYFLKPMLKDATPTFIGMTEGDGRNDALWRWRGKLEMTNKLTPVEIEKSIRIINENLFSIPIPNNELFKTVLRDKDDRDNKKNSLKENIFNKYADQLIERYDIISYGENFYKYNGTYYKQIPAVEIERMIHFEISHDIPDAGRKEVLKFIRIKTQVSVSEFDKCWYKIACKNGIINLVNGELEMPTKADINTIFLPYNYTTEPTYSPRIDTFMKDITGGDINKMIFLYQIAGYCLLKKNLFEKFFLFRGEGGTGKSTYMNLIHKLVGGDANCSHIGLSDFDKDYYLASTISKLVNIDDDVVDGKILENTGRFKSLVSGNIITVRQIYKEPVDYIPYCTCIFSCNKLPKIMDRTSGMYRRIVLLELNNKVKNPDKLFMQKISDDDMEYFLYKAVDAIKDALEEGKFKITYSEKELMNLFMRRQSAINEWCYENGLSLGNIHEKRCNTLYQAYTLWAQDNGYSNKMTIFTFKEEICTLFNVQVRIVIPEGAKVPVPIFYKAGEFNPDYRPF